MDSGGISARLGRLFGEPSTLAWVQVFVLLAARLAPLALFSPLFGGWSTSLRVRLGLGIALAAGLTPIVAGALTLSGPTPGPTLGTPLGESEILFQVAKEVLFGTALAVLVAAIFELFAAAGALIDRSRGAAPGGESVGVEASAGAGVSVFFKLFFVTIFFASGAHQLFFGALGEGLIRVPLGDVRGAGFMAAPSAVGQIAALAGELFAAALQLALPVIAIALIVDVSLGIFHRAGGPFAAFFMGLSIKGTMGVAALLLTLGMGAEAFLEAVPSLVQRLAQMR